MCNHIKIENAIVNVILLRMSEQKHHQLIWDVNQIERFQNLFMNGFDNEHVHLIYLAARRKYDEKQPLAGSTCFNRQVINQKTRSLVDMIRMYEIPVGTYSDKTGSVIRDDALVVYYLLNHRNAKTAYSKFAKKMLDRLCGAAEEKFDDLISELKSAIHSASNSKRYIELDVDTKEPAIVQKVLNVLNQPLVKGCECPIKTEQCQRTRSLTEFVICTVETHGGYHIVLDNEKLGKDARGKLWQEFNSPEYKFAGADFHGKPITKSYVDVRSDPSPPIPGTLQGGFPVRMVRLDELEKIENLNDRSQ